MTKLISKRIPFRSLCIMLFVAVAAFAVGQTPSDSPADARGVFKLRVRVGQGPGTKATGLSRKRFFLVKGSLAELNALLQNINQPPAASRDCYYRSIGASEALIAWLRQSDCESVYCREVEPKDIDGAEAVPEFQHAVQLGEKEFGNRDLARKWLTTNLRDQLRDGYYKQQQSDIKGFLKQAEELSKAGVQSVMTDTNGTAYFTDIEPGTYVVSNMFPAELGSTGAIWNCEITVKPGDLATVKPYLLANTGNKDPRDVKNIKCVSAEKRLPDCPAASK